MPRAAQGLEAEVDEVSGARETDGDEERVRRRDQHREACARGERPQGLAERDTGGGAHAVCATAEQRVANRERGVRPGCADDDGGEHEEAAEMRHVRTSGLYLIRCGSSASAPRVSRTQSAY